MKEYYLRKDIQKILKISRRVIEGYEKLNLIQCFDCVSGMKHYSLETLQTTAVIRFLQETGLSLEEIKKLLSSKKDLKEIMKERITVLRKKKMEIETMIVFCRQLTAIDDLQNKDILKLFEKEEIK